MGGVARGEQRQIKELFIALMHQNVSLGVGEPGRTVWRGGSCGWGGNEELRSEESSRQHGRGHSLAREEILMSAKHF